MSVHDLLLQRSAAMHARNAVDVQFQPEGGSAVAVSCQVGPEDVAEVEFDGNREVMRMHPVEYLISEIPELRVQRDGFVIGGELWLVSKVTKGVVSGFAEVVRPERVEKAGRGRLAR